MLKNRLLALAVRLAGAITAVSGICFGSGMNAEKYSLFFYTTQSNIFAAAVMAYLAAKTLYGLAKEGIRGSADYCPRLEAACALTIGFTFIVFWGIIAPFAGSHGISFRMWSYGNLALHALAPLLCILDYFLFSEGGRLKKRDILLPALIPAAYVIQTLCLSLSGFVYYIKDGVNVCCPYPFMDFRDKASLSLLFLALVSSSFIGAAAILYRMDKRRAAKNGNIIPEK